MGRDQRGRRGRGGHAVVREAVGHPREELAEGLTRVGNHRLIQTILRHHISSEGSLLAFVLLVLNQPSTRSRSWFAGPLRTFPRRSKREPWHATPLTVTE